MFINFWYAAALATDVTADKPLKVRMLGQNFSLFRDSAGVARCVSDICIHRCASLSAGRVKGDNVECPYHGWRFNGDGACTRIPSLGVDAKIPARARIDGYPTDEKYGLVFAFLGDLPEAERPPLLAIPEWGREGWRCINLEYTWAANWERSIEAGLDPAHAEFVHTGMKFAGADEEYAIPSDLKVERQPWGTTMDASLRTIALQKRPELGNADISSAKPKAMETGVQSIFHGPNCTVTRIKFSETDEVCQYMWETPMDEFNVAKHLVSVRSIMTDRAFDDSFNKRNLFVADEDKGVVEGIDPMVFPDSSTKEVFVPADAQIAAYRQYIKDWQARGWRIDSKLVEANKGRVAYAIPSPGRRESRNFPLDTVPLLPAQAEGKQAASG
jgi:phenylpropionate dioxygenase-like ring-hydroxylating dioxygenase large terminal subunit